MSRGDEAVLDDLEIDKGTDTSGADGGGGRIRCPVCAWTPQSDSVWMCSCSHLWNTFDTGGVCPACLLQWAYTACPQCGAWSPHSDWYRKL